MVEGRPYMNEGCFVDDEEAVVELVGGLDRERVGVLRVDAQGGRGDAERTVSDAK